jgi:anti-sigma28 factor (negative regulator of flagellin synthesis)
VNTKPSDPRAPEEASASAAEDRRQIARKARLEVIRTAVRSGQYDIPAMDIAESILNRASGGLLTHE